MTDAPPAVTAPLPVADVLHLVGDTPLVEVRNIDTGPCRLFLKLESFNPGGSIKDRIGLSMIEAAEAAGDLVPGGTIIEATAGNTGIGLALAAAIKGYRLILVIPDKMSAAKIFHLKALGAEVHMTRSDVTKGHPEYYQDAAARLVEETPGAWWANQFGNAANPAAHETTTGPEIWEQMGRNVDAIVCGVGSGGTITGIGRYFKSVSPETEVILADPEGSILADLVNTGAPAAEVGSWVVEGIGEDFVPPISDLGLATRAYTIPDKEALEASRELLSLEGIMSGSSSGTLLAAALRYCREQSAPKRVVSLVCDGGNKYLSKHFNDYWMRDQGFIDRPTSGDLSDLIGRRSTEHAVVTAAPEETLNTAFGRMTLHDISQLPVMEDRRIIGLLDEEDILVRVIGDSTRFDDTVREAMTERLETVDASSPVEALLPIFEQGRVAIVMDGDQFLGLITRIDLLNYLRRRL